MTLAGYLYKIMPDSAFAITLDVLPMTAVPVEAAIQALMMAKPVALVASTKSEDIILRSLEAKEGICMVSSKRTVHTAAKEHATENFKP